MKFPENASKQQRSIVYLYVAHFEEKNSFCLYLSSFTALKNKGYLWQIVIYLSFPNLLTKKKFRSISELLSEIVIFLTKLRVFSEFLQKCFKTTEKHSLSV